MKKILLAISILFVSISGQAQFTVKSNGSAHLGNHNYMHQYFSDGFIGFGSTFRKPIGQNILGLQGYAVFNTPSSSDLSIGVFGVAGNGNNNFGVAGYIASGPTGAAIFGSTLHDFNVNIQGMYSGYFNGEVYVATKLTVPTIVSPSDIRLKENVISVSETENTSRYLDRLLDMNVIEYNYKRPDFLVETQSSSNEQFEKALKHRHVGFVAQEMQELFPNLVEEGQDGYLGVNYVELVPVLIRAIQELKQELDEVKGETKAKMHSFSSETTDLIADVTGNVLYQNTPNPFKEKTVIRFNLAENVKNASICIFDMTGKMLKKLPISSGMDSVSIGGYELGEGMFLYSLIVNGQEIDTKRMIITK